jgi:hypothetical protein
MEDSGRWIVPTACGVILAVVLLVLVVSLCGLAQIVLGRYRGASVEVLHYCPDDIAILLGDYRALVGIMPLTEEGDIGDAYDIGVDASSVDGAAS